MERTLLLFVTALLFSPEAAQRGGIGKYQGKRVGCFQCDADFTFNAEKYAHNHSCLAGPSDPKERERGIAQCSQNSRYCLAEVTRLNGVLTSFSRKCAESCELNCIQSGYAMDTEICTYCCESFAYCAENRNKIDNLHRGVN
ncbi:uncharacterized protein LOC100906483 [Galendromus occidentalis]|uniref:Uncharacterized protein LOC100906483 n=1 Tax=Galendromus occidentalis TaxID=34638 RepID=A0AAJ6QPX4_9ACAR|nr:uncharacterized protein LOC100906483 [Galendromus occidentalis]